MNLNDLPSQGDLDSNQKFKCFFSILSEDFNDEHIRYLPSPYEEFYNESIKYLHEFKDISPTLWAQSLHRIIVTFVNHCKKLTGTECYFKYRNKTLVINLTPLRLQHLSIILEHAMLGLAYLAIDGARYYGQLVNVLELSEAVLELIPLGIGGMDAKMKKEADKKKADKQRKEALKTVGNAAVNIAKDEKVQKAAWNIATNLFKQAFQGSGDYTVNPVPVENSIIKSDTPINTKFRTVPNGDGLRVNYREYIGEINNNYPGSFQLNTYNINPGLQGSMPRCFLYSLLFQNFVINGFVVEIQGEVSTYVNTGILGTIMVSSSFDVGGVAAPASKTQLLNLNDAISFPVNEAGMYGVECKLLSKRSYQCRTFGSVGNNTAIDYDPFIIYVGLSTGPGVAAGRIAEIYFAYDITFLNSRLPLYLFPCGQLTYTTTSSTSVLSPVATNYKTFNNGITLTISGVQAVFSGFNPGDSLVVVIYVYGTALNTFNFNFSQTESYMLNVANVVLPTGLQSTGPNAITAWSSATWRQTFLCNNSNTSFPFSPVQPTLTLTGPTVATSTYGVQITVIRTINAAQLEYSINTGPDALKYL